MVTMDKNMKKPKLVLRLQ